MGNMIKLLFVLFVVMYVLESMQIDADLSSLMGFSLIEPVVCAKARRVRRECGILDGLHRIYENGSTD